MAISAKAQDTQDTTQKPHEAQEEGIQKCGYIDPSWKVDQHTNGLQPTNRLRIGSSVEQLEKRAEEIFSPIRGTTSTNQYPQCSQRQKHQTKKTHSSSYLCSREWPFQTSVRGEAIAPIKAPCPSVGE